MNNWKWKWSHLVVSDSLQPHGLQLTRLLHPWDSPGKSTGVGCFLVQNNFKHDKYKKEECHEPYISSFSINNYKTKLSPTGCHRLETMQHQGGGQLSSQQKHSWLASVFLLLVCSHMWWLKGRKKRENKREKEGEANPIMRDHHQNPMSTWVPPKGPTS